MGKNYLANNSKESIFSSLKKASKKKTLSLPDLKIISREQPSANIPKQLYAFLAKTNGIYAYADALHVFPSDKEKGANSLEWWNDKTTWTKEYEEDLSRYLFFAEDIFGYQFALKDTKVFLFDPIEATFKPLAPTFNAWLRKVQSDPNEVGYGFAKDWQHRHKLKEGDRILAYPPFSFLDSGRMRSYKAVERSELLQFYIQLHKKVKDMPDGGQLEVKVTD